MYDVMSIWYEEAIVHEVSPLKAEMACVTMVRFSICTPRLGKFMRGQEVNNDRKS